MSDTNYYPIYSNVCMFRLPCGLCSRTMQTCPMGDNGNIKVTWDVNTEVEE